MKNVTDHGLHIIVSEIVRESDGKVTFKEHNYNANDQEYFYPASTVKLPIALLAAEKINADDRLTINTPFKVQGDSIYTTISNEIQKIFAVSDNDAYNRLYEYLGRDYINERLSEKGLSARISHRLSVANAADPITKPCYFLAATTDSISINPKTNSPITPLNISGLLKGKGYIKGDSLINEPFDFSLKNHLPLITLHDIVKRVFFPDNFKETSRFYIPENDMSRIKNLMSTLPFQAGYDREEFYDSYVKFFMFGDENDPMPDHIKIFNKVGYAYGTLTDSAYILDESTGVEFIISATIMTNKNGIFNDDTYEYDSLGIPFLAQLGREIHQALVNQKKQ